MNKCQEGRHAIGRDSNALPVHRATLVMAESHAPPLDGAKNSLSPSEPREQLT